ncbi:MAG: hypothetical protein IT383_17345 [Deltaproteobacteria bacterium]|nr:hypothetical protein [Deltaproteobacteria bacterium]
MANLMDLVRELKTLNARKKAGDALSPAEESRRKELKSYLRDALEQQSGGSSLEDSAIRDASSQRSGAQRPVGGASSAPKPAPSASSAPKPVPSASSAPKPPPTQGAKPLSMADIAASQKAPSSGGKPSAVAAPFVDDEVIPDPPKARVTPSAAAAPFVDDDVIPDPPKKQAPPPYVPKKDAFAIDFGKANDLISNAMKSDAVAKVDPLALKQAHASAAEIEDSEARADAAVRANKKRPRAQTADEAAEQLQGTEAAYTPPESNLALEQYYGAYADEGFATIEATAAGELRPIDPREIELQKLDAAGGSVTITVPPGLAFLDDFAALYAKRILPSPDDEVVVDSTDPNLLIPGKRKVTVHLLNGEKRQGAIRALRRGELGFKLEPLGSGSTEELSISQCKAVFIHLQANQPPKDIRGRSLTVTFGDSRSVQGVSDDYQPGAPVFTLVPPAGRGQFERIIVNGAAVKSVG